MTKYNDIGIDSSFNLYRIRKLLLIGFSAGLMVLIGDMLLGWGTAVPGTSGLEANYSKYIGVSDSRIFWSALLGTIGIPLECMSWFGIYRMMAERSPNHAHAYRAGIFGCMLFGVSVHVSCCAAVYYYNRMNTFSPDTALSDMGQFALYFLLPSTILFVIFFIIVIGVQFHAFIKEMTPYPKWCCIFSMLFGVLAIVVCKAIGDYPLTNALATGWISLGNIFMSGGLLLTIRIYGRNKNVKKKQ